MQNNNGAANAVPDTLVAGKYRLTRLLGKGGMGSVWEGQHISLGTRVAVKFIESDYINSQEARSRFVNEARAAATLSSKHVVKVFDHGVMDDGRPYIVMEFLNGEPLDRRLERLQRLPLPDTAKIVVGVARALTRAHQSGIVHRDLKPENVFLVWDEEDKADLVKVVDFGIAKFTDQSMGISSSTRTGSVLGTPFYMSPEQARGLKSVDYRSDLWSLGVIVFRCVTGQLPFSGEAVGDLLVKLCTAPVPMPSSVLAGLPPTFDQFIARALAREPSERFTTAEELSNALCNVANLPATGAQASAGLPLAQMTTMPADIRGSSPALAQSGARRALGAADLTGAPTYSTLAPGGSRGKKVAVVLVAAAAAVGVAALIATGVSGGDAPTEENTNAASQAPAQGIEPQKTVEPEPAIAVSPVEPANTAQEPPEAQSSEPQPGASADAVKEPSKKKTASSRPASKPVKKRVPKVTSPPPPVEKPVVQPAPVRTVKKPVERTPPKPAKKDIDVGY